VLRDLPYGSAAPLQRMDVYRPSGAHEASVPAVILVTGYSDVGSRKMVGCSLKEMASYIGWARLIASAGMIAIAYETEEPVRDTKALFAHIESHSASVGIDPSRLGVWSCSGNVPNALAVLQTENVACAALCYGYMLDEDGFDEVAKAAAQFGFATGAPAPTLDALRDVAMLVVRAGRDETPGLNASLDRYVARALAENAYVSVLNQPDGQHAFDLLDDTDRSRSAIRQILGFLSTHLHR
jgi:hypothetical protein